MEINADLHIHSRYSGGTSDVMNMRNLSKGASQKGINLIGSGDCLHPRWLEEIKALEKVDEGTFEIGGLRVILTCEVEDCDRVHHLLMFPSISKVEEFSEKILSKVSDLTTDGRPRFHGNGADLAAIARDCGVLIGPCHAFTPWTSVYAAFDSLKECYGELVGYVGYIELGLSADTSYADRIAELHDLTFLTNSDAHSPWPVRLAREFMRMEVEEAIFEEVAMAILRRKGRQVVLNVGVPPEEGKYNESACIKCYAHYTLNDAVRNGWRCRCGGRIKKGVRDRVEELADYPEPKTPSHRPRYIHIIPLTEIIAKALGSSPNSKKVLEIWDGLINKFGNEVRILIDTEIEEISKVAPPEVIRAIAAFRAGKVLVKPGGGGQYGEIVIPDGGLETSNISRNASTPSMKKGESGRVNRHQPTLDSFS
ncbi:MAG: TIGR00375 family protein [Thermoplasmata archaeon]|nr:TIGR00375 family protein [Thermoplasmata archaeon]